jgi:hypothetical protein
MPAPRTLLLYGGLTLATLGWWFAAFHTSHIPLQVSSSLTYSLLYPLMNPIFLAPFIDIPSIGHCLGIFS